MSTSEHWGREAALLLQLPGFGMIVTMTVLSAIGEVKRFDSARKLVGYAGLGSSVHASGQKRRTGRITKSGRKEMRWVLVAAARHAARTHPYWKAEFEQLVKRLGKYKAWVAIARKLLVAVWHILTKGEPDRHTGAKRIARKLYLLSQELRPKHFEELGLTRQQYVRYQLLQLGVGDELDHPVPEELGRGVPWSRGKRSLLAPVSNSRYGEMTILAKANPGSPSLSQVAIRRSGGKPEAK